MPFTAEERVLLLRTPRLGPVVVSRLEAAGLDTMARLAAISASQVIEIVCSGNRRHGWQNRRRALEQAVDEWQRRHRSEP